MDYLPSWLAFSAPLVGLVAGVALAPVAQRYFTRGEDRVTESSEDGAAEGDGERSFGSITAPIVGITTLVLSFTLVQTWMSYQQAVISAHAEAVAVDYQSDMARLIPNRAESKAATAALVCYSRAIVGPEWAAMERDEDVTADEVRVWTTQIAAEIGRPETNTPGREAGRATVRADQERQAARSDRLLQGRPSIPFALLLLLVVAAALAVASLALANLPRERRAWHIGALAVVALLFSGLLLAITDLDSPYSGVLRLEPTDMARTAEDGAREYAARFPGEPLPCDGQGRVIR